MQNQEPNPNKTGRIDRETPALVLLRDGNVLEAAHQFTNTDGQLCVYLESRDDRIDVKINLDDVVAIIKSRDAARALNVEDEFAGDGELVADGGFDTDALQWVSEGPQGIRPAKKFVHTRCGSRAARIETQDADAYYCPECDETTTMRFGDIDIVRINDGDVIEYERVDNMADASESVQTAAAGATPPEFEGDDGRPMTDGGFERKSGAHEGRPVIPDNPVTTIDLDAVERGDAVTDMDGTVAGHVIDTYVQDLQAHGYRDVVEYVTVDGDEVRAEAFEIMPTVCRQCGDIVLPDGGYVTSHDNGCCNDDASSDVERGDHVWLNGGPRPLLVQNVSEHHPDDTGNDTDDVKIAVGGHDDPLDPGFVDPARVERCSECGDLTDGTACVCDADDTDYNGIPVITGNGGDELGN